MVSRKADFEKTSQSKTVIRFSVGYLHRFFANTF